MPTVIQGLTVEIYYPKSIVQQGLIVRDLLPVFTSDNATLSATGITTAAFTFVADALASGEIFRRDKPTQAKRLLPVQSRRNFPRS